MKLAISAKGQTLDSELDPRFGRAKYFLLVDPEAGSLEVVENKQNLQYGPGSRHSGGPERGGKRGTGGIDGQLRAQGL